MKKLVLDTLDNKAALVLYSLNKSRIELGVIHDTLSTKTAEAAPVSELLRYLQYSVAEIVRNTANMGAALHDLYESATEIETAAFDYHPLMESIYRSIVAIGTPPSNRENSIGKVARSLTLMSLIFSDLAKLNDSFREWCDESKANPNQPFEWTEGSRADLDFGFPSVR